MGLDKAERRLTWVWVTLMAMTLISVRSGQTSTGKSGLTGIIVVLAFAKVAIVASEFMEVRHAPDWLRLTLAIWVFVVGGAVLAMLRFPGVI